MENGAKSAPPSHLAQPRIARSVTVPPTPVEGNGGSRESTGGITNQSIVSEDTTSTPIQYGNVAKPDTTNTRVLDAGGGAAGTVPTLGRLPRTQEGSEEQDRMASALSNEDMYSSSSSSSSSSSAGPPGVDTDQSALSYSSYAYSTSDDALYDHSHDDDNDDDSNGHGHDGQSVEVYRGAGKGGGHGGTDRGRKLKGKAQLQIGVPQEPIPVPLYSASSIKMGALSASSHDIVTATASKARSSAMPPHEEPWRFLLALAVTAGTVAIFIIGVMYVQWTPIILQGGTEDVSTDASDTAEEATKGFKMGPFLAYFILTWDNMISALLSPKIGQLSDTIWVRYLGRRKPFILIGLPIGTLFFCLIPYAKRGYEVMIYVIMHSIGMAICKPCQAAYMGDLFPAVYRTRTSATIYLTTAFAAVGTLGVGAFVVNQHGTGALFVCIGVFSMLMLIVTAVFVQEVKPRTRRGTGSHGGHMARLKGAPHSKGGVAASPVRGGGNTTTTTTTTSTVGTGIHGSGGRRRGQRVVFSDVPAAVSSADRRDHVPVTGVQQSSPVVLKDGTDTPDVEAAMSISDDSLESPPLQDTLFQGVNTKAGASRQQRSNNPTTTTTTTKNNVTGKRSTDNGGIRHNIALLWNEPGRQGVYALTGTFFSMIGATSVQTGLSSFIVYTLGYTLGEASFFSAVFAVGFLVGAVATSWVKAPHIRRRIVLGSEAGIIVAVTLAFFIVQDRISLGILLSLAGILGGGLVVNLLPFVFDELSDVLESGAITGMFYLALASASILGPAMTGALVEASGTHRIMFLVAAFTMSIGLLLYTLGHPDSLTWLYILRDRCLRRGGQNTRPHSLAATTVAKPGLPQPGDIVGRPDRRKGRVHAVDGTTSRRGGARRGSTQV